MIALVSSSLGLLVLKVLGLPAFSASSRIMPVISRTTPASRMESLGLGGTIQITRATYELVKDDFVCEARGVVHVKGKGEMEIWHVTGAKPIMADAA